MQTNSNATTRDRSQIVKRILQLLIALCIVVFTALVFGFAFQSVATRDDNQQFPPPGQLIDVGNHHLHIDCQGSGSPTVVVDNGAGNWSTMSIPSPHRRAKK